MPDDTALLIGGDDQRLQAGGAPDILERRDLGAQRLDGPAADVVAGDVDAADQALPGKARNFWKRRITDHEVGPELARLGGAGTENLVLAQLELEMRGGQQHCRQAPEHDECLAGDGAPAPRPQQHDDDHNACDDKRNVSGAAQHE